LLIISEQIVEEFVEVLHRPRFKTTKREIREAKNALVKIGKVIKVTSKRKVAKEDPDDDIFINTALDGKADYIVSGDPHLLSLSNYKGIEILTVNDMLKKFGY
jgi:putative PIN family toxin of toxin-antitoxin system